MNQIGRNPFARETLLKQSRLCPGQTCDWCGSTRKDRHLYQYFVERDGINTRPVGIRGMFCGIDCMRAFRGESLHA